MKPPKITFNLRKSYDFHLLPSISWPGRENRKVLLKINPDMNRMIYFRFIRIELTLYIR